MDKSAFTANLIRLRKSSGMTQKQLADTLGVSDRSVSKWETGETEPDISTLCRMAELLHPLLLARCLYADERALHKTAENTGE